MVFDLDLIKAVYENLPSKVDRARALVGRPLTLTEKILYAHVGGDLPQAAFERGGAYVDFTPDRVAMQDATAQMALLQFMSAGKAKVAVPSTVHCDHLIQAKDGATADLKEAKVVNKEVYDFLASVSTKYGIGFWKPGAGIIHQIVFENYAFPGGMMVGTDSHTVNAGGLGMVAIGVGGADAVDVMVGMPWELKFPKVIGVKLTGKMNGWASAKDLILKIAGILTVSGGTDAIIEYFGEGADSISATGKGTICNMGAEVGATTSIFGYDANMARYLDATGRSQVAELANGVKDYLRTDPEVVANPEMYFDRVVEINLSELEPYINGPFTPDKAWPISEFAQAVEDNNYPEKLDVGLIGSCTNSSYEDITRAASIAQQADAKNIKVKGEFIITPGSEMIRYTMERDGLLDVFNKIGGVVLANACGPCIGQWARHDADKGDRNSILTSFNRNFAKRNDGNPNTFAFVASPEVVTALTIAGSLKFNPLTDKLKNENGEEVKFDDPIGFELPVRGFDVEDNGYQAPSKDGSSFVISVDPSSKRIQLLQPFKEWNGADLKGLKLLIKARGKCTTDHISMAGPWLKYRGHLENISQNMLIGATNSFNGHTNSVKSQIDHKYVPVPDAAKSYRDAGYMSIVIGDENYGEGSSREHAAMEPRFLGVTVILVKSFARIHQTNLKKQGILALTFVDKGDYDKILEDDVLDVLGLESFEEGKNLTVVLHHNDGTTESFKVAQTYNENQFEWFKAGSALNLIKKSQK